MNSIRAAHFVKLLTPMVSFDTLFITNGPTFSR